VDVRGDASVGVLDRLPGDGLRFCGWAHGIVFIAVRGCGEQPLWNGWRNFVSKTISTELFFFSGTERVAIRNRTRLRVEICRNNFCLLRAMNEFSLDLA
jgi:hypothetical protein